MYTVKNLQPINSLARFSILVSYALSCLCAASSPAFAAGLNSDQVDKFAREMHAKHSFNAKSLVQLLGSAQRMDSILAAIAKPAEYKPWHAYRPIFITDARIRGGVAFWRQHEAALAAATKQYGVAAEIIVAIIGVETAYGHNTGNYRVLDALATLAFHYPPRAAFFRGELEKFLLLTREEAVVPTTPKGSYAGAMGIPQFMPSSFLAYAVDFTGDGHRDIWNNPQDAIGSVANYLKVHGWQPAQPIALRALESPANATQKSDKVELQRPIDEYAALGVTPDGQAAHDARAVLLAFEGLNAPEYWLALQNFYVITRYNRSPKYALAVFQLGEEIRAARTAL